MLGRPRRSEVGRVEGRTFAGTPGSDRPDPHRPSRAVARHVHRAGLATRRLNQANRPGNDDSTIPPRRLRVGRTNPHRRPLPGHAGRGPSRAHRRPRTRAAGLGNHRPGAGPGDAARERENEAESGHFRGPLHGVPVGIKDIFYTEGMATTACSRILADFVPDYDAPCVAKLKVAGAIVLGKTVTTEFAAGDPPPTLNAWNHAHTPGGSSSGSSVAVSTGMCAAALGSQTAGSVCRPASFNGVVGLKAQLRAHQPPRRRGL